jgi:hypothetical protein
MTSLNDNWTVKIQQPTTPVTLAEQFAARGFGPPAADQRLTFGDTNQYAK